MSEIIFPALYGNEKLKNSVGNDLLLHRQSHAYIFEGDDGSGKMTAALSFAAALVCDRRSERFPCGECAACRKVFGGCSPDVEITALTDRKSIGVDAVRAIRDGLYVIPNDGDFRVYIIDGADTLTTQAQNALLISLEEPPPFVVFLLLAQSAENLIETVRSRATLIRMERFGDEQIIEFLETHPDSAEFAARDIDRTKKIASAANGSPGRALDAIAALGATKRSASKSDAESEEHTAAASLCEALLRSDRAAALDVLRAIPRGSENARAVLSLCLDALRDVMNAKCRASFRPIFYADAENAVLLARKTTLKRVEKLFSAIDEYIWLLSQNSSETIITTLIAME